MRQIPPPLTGYTTNTTYYVQHIHTKLVDATAIIAVGFCPPQKRVL